MLSRRGLIGSLISLAAAPAIVRASSLMPVKAIQPSSMLPPYERLLLLRQWVDEAYRITRESTARCVYGDRIAYIDKAASSTMKYTERLGEEFPFHTLVAEFTFD